VTTEVPPLQQLGALALQDEGLLRELQAPRTWDEFAATAIEAAAARGIALTREDVDAARAAANTARRERWI
jgi:hypothetical protein